jgi:hypothetical protein
MITNWNKISLKILLFAGICICFSSCKKEEEKEKVVSPWDPNETVLEKFDATVFPFSFNGYSIDLDEILKKNKRFGFTGNDVDFLDVRRLDNQYEITGTLGKATLLKFFYFKLEADEKTVEIIRSESSELYVGTQTSTDLTLEWSHRILIVEIESFAKLQPSFQIEEENESWTAALIENKYFLIKGKIIAYVPNK